MMLRIITIGAFFVCTQACQKKPHLAPAADPLSALEPPPMGATTYNDELKRELKLLDDVHNGRIAKNTLIKLKNALIHADKNALPQNPNSDEAYLVKIFIALPELLQTEGIISKTKQLWHTAKLYFINRHFPDAAILMTEVIKAEPDFIEAQNWRARAMFFLGNPDGAVSDLLRIIQKTGESSAHGIDALYLIGAIRYESNDFEAHRIKEGIKAWSTYLQLADVPEMTKEVTDGLQELHARLKGEKTESFAGKADPFSENPRYSAEKNAILRAFKKEELLLALELANSSLKKLFDPDIATIKARILFKTGSHDEAGELFALIVKNKPTYAPGFHYQGMAFMMQGKPKEAILSWQKVIELDKNYGESHNIMQRIGVAQKMVAPQKIETH